TDLWPIKPIKNRDGIKHPSVITVLSGIRRISGAEGRFYQRRDHTPSFSRYLKFVSIKITGVFEDERHQTIKTDISFSAFHADLRDGVRSGGQQSGSSAGP
ncbi:MAG: hypothetical protein IKW74_02770, partial [Thermoguttaceae bacterium]|nr:hypothetical protein [Thermoguttaceae bacterium]